MTRQELAPAKPIDVGAWFAERARVNAWLVRSLAQQPGGMAVIDAIYGEDEVAALLRGDAPRLKAVTR